MRDAERCVVCEEFFPYISTISESVVEITLMTADQYDVWVEHLYGLRKVQP